MKVCYFGIYNPEYSRNRILIKGLKQNDVEVIECRTDCTGIKKYFDLIKKHWRIRHDYDILIAGFPGNHSAVLAKLLTRKPVVFDAYLSFYNALIFDRKESSPKSLRALRYWLVDFLPSQFADRVLLDTQEHINYFVKTFKAKRRKFIRVFIGADDDVFVPSSDNNNNNSDFIVGFHGMFVPTQGAEYIVKAAEILKGHQDIKFDFVGSGKDYDKTVKLAQELKLDNVKFYGRVDFREVPKYVAGFDIVLGNFGDTDKTTRVIANKTYETLAMSKPHLSADVPAMREFFTDRQDILFCQTANPQDLAEKILILKNDKELMKKIAEGGYKIFKERATPKVVAGQLLADLSKKIKK